MTSPATRIRLIVSWMLMFAFVWFAIELISFSGLKILDRFKDIRYKPVRFEHTRQNRRFVRRLINDRAGIRSLSPTLGWTNKPNTEIKAEDGGDPSNITRINAQGLRSLSFHEYPLTPDKDMVRILAFGDSFTYGSEVAGKDCWAEILSSYSPQVEVLNFGVAGFGLDQALLRYDEEGKQFNPRIVLMGFLTADITRHVNVYRPFLSKDGLPAAKPRFLLDEGTLKLLPNPLPSLAHYQELLEHEAEVITDLGKFDHFYQKDYREGRFDVLPSVRLSKVLHHDFRKNHGIDAIILDRQFNTGSEAYQVTIKLFERFTETVSRDGATPVAVIFPHGKDIKRFRKDRTKSYTPLLEDLDRRGIKYVDLMNAFASTGQTHPTNDFLSPNAHYSVLGNQLVAHHLWKHLESHQLLN